MERILVAVDGSEIASRALKMAAEIARRFEARLTTVHVVIPLFLPQEGYGSHSASLELSQRKSGEQLAQEAVTTAREYGVQADALTLWGAPADMILEASEAPDVSLVVLGSRGRGALSRALLGSVSDAVVRHAKKPVLIVH